MFDWVLKLPLQCLTFWNICDSVSHKSCRNSKLLPVSILRRNVLDAFTCLFNFSDKMYVNKKPLKVISKKSTNKNFWVDFLYHFLKILNIKICVIAVYLFMQEGIFGALRDLVPCAQFKEREKHPWRIVTFSKVGG